MYAAEPRRPITRHEARLWEERFLEGVSANVARLAAIAPRPGARPMSARRLDSRVQAFDRADEVRRVLAQRGIYDRAVLEAMPTDGARVIEFRRRGLLGGRRPVVRMVALAVNPLDGLAAEGPEPGGPPPATLAQVAGRLGPLLTHDGTFHRVAAFSPTGWEPAALTAGPAGDDYELYLVEKGTGSQWVVHPPATGGDLAAVFDPETDAERRARCRDFIEAHRGDTMLAGIAVETLVRSLAVGPPAALAALGDAARRDPHLRLQTVGGSRRLVYTDEPVLGTGESIAPQRSGRRNTMGLWQWLLETLRIRKKAPDPAEVVRQLEERRIRAQAQRDQIDAQIADLERAHRDLGEQLRAESARTRQTSLAQNIANVRHRIKQMQRRVAIFDKAISVYNTHIDNLTLAREAHGFQLPAEAEMKEVAIEVDGLVDEINEAADLALGMDAGAAADAVNPEVESILAEFGAAAPKAKVPDAARPAPAPEPARESPPPAPRQKAPPATD
jgi:division protein CdvB (Snf7/Vps24/ESCRT-III family)